MNLKKGSILWPSKRMFNFMTLKEGLILWPLENKVWSFHIMTLKK